VSGSGTVLQLSSLVPPARFGGAERVVGWLTEELRQAGLRVHNVGLAPRGQARATDGTHALRNLYWPFDGRQRNVVLRSAWHAVDTWLQLARGVVDRLVDEVEPSVLVTHNLRGWGYAPWEVARARGLPLVHVVHDHGLLCYSTSLWRGGICAELCAACRFRRDATQRHWPGGQAVGVSTAVLAAHQQHGVDFGQRTAVAHPTEAAASMVAPAPPRGRSTSVPATLGYLGRLSEGKGIHLLLHAMRTTSQRLLVAGDGEPSTVAALRSESGNNVEWLGWADATAFFSAIDVLVVPSLLPEPFGLVVVEAATAGVPVLIADRAGLVEAARAAYALYSVFPPGDESALRAALRRPTSEYETRPPADKGTDLVELIRQAAGSGADL
jgi:glycosyltransferase involved in cell wall biosynthesis